MEKKDIVIIGTGFGACMTGLSLGYELQQKKLNKKILMMERGSWWTTPVGTVQDKEVKTYEFLKGQFKPDWDKDGKVFSYLNNNKQPVQYWSSSNDFKGVIDILTRCFRRGNNKDGLFDFSMLGRIGIKGFLKNILTLFRNTNDGISIVRACGVGGGSLVYSNITIRPPELIFNDKRWEAVKWDKNERDKYFNLARHAIGFGVISARKLKDEMPYQKKDPPPNSVNAGLSNIVARSARLDPHWVLNTDHLDLNPRGLKQINPDNTFKNVPSNRFWIDRARIFQTAVSDLKLSDEWGAVDLSINDLTREGVLTKEELPTNYSTDEPRPPVNYCERQGRCNVGCLPGARHTLNKQLMSASLGTLKDAPALNTDFNIENYEIRPLCIVRYIEADKDGGYLIHYDQYEDQTLKEGFFAGLMSLFHVKKTKKEIKADNVIVSAGCLGTSEIMLRSKENGGLPGLSDKAGSGFSTNGDYIAFMEKTKFKTILTRGPVTTSFAHFNSKDGTSDTNKFHSLEDQGIPPAFSSLIGFGLPVFRSIAKGRNKWLFVIFTVTRFVLNRLWLLIKSPFVNHVARQDNFKSNEEITGNLMSVVGAGREASIGQFSLGGWGETSLRLNRTDGKRFSEDDIYTDIKGTLDKLGKLIEDAQEPDSEKKEFRTPVENMVSVSHPLGGCRIGKNADEGVVDEYGKVYNKLNNGYYEGLYIADGSIMPTALGVNPSLTISALTLRIANKIIDEIK